MPNPINEIAIVSGQINANVSGSFQTSVSGNIIDINILNPQNMSGTIINVNTSISGNILTLVSTGGGGTPIVKAGKISLTGTAQQFPDIQVTRGVTFIRAVAPGGGPGNFWIGGLSGNNVPYWINDSNTNGIPNPSFLAITNLNQVKGATQGVNSGTVVDWFAISDE
jgi:hypothetical protein